MTHLNFPPGGTPLDSTEGLRVPGVFTYEQLSDVEAENIAAATLRHLRPHRLPTIKWLTEPFIRRLHREMFSRVWTWAGTYRRNPLNIGVAPHRIPEEIAKLLADIPYWETGPACMEPMERAIRVHHRLAWIHPFNNGNGRHARLLANIYLLSQKAPLPEWRWKDLAQSGPLRKRYLEAIRAADQGDFKPLLEFTMKMVTRR